jgi:hypoxanthine phosphoribosyltransferase
LCVFAVQPYEEVVGCLCAFFVRFIQGIIRRYSIREKLGVGGKKVVIVGDVLHSRVALSNIYALQMQGAEVKAVQNANTKTY